MAVDVSPALCWKNRRKKSLYVEEAGLGFIFRKVNKTETVKENVEPLANGAVQQPLLVNGGPIEPMPALFNGHAQGFEEETVPSQDSTAELNVSMDTSLLDGEELEEELLKEVELKRFMAQLKKELISSGGATSEHDVDKVLSDVGQDLKESGLYFKYMEADGPDELLPHPLTEQLKEHIDTLKASTERYRRELKEWDVVLERKRAELDQARQNCESNKKINFSNLRPEDVAALKTYLTADQLQLLDHPPPVDGSFVQQASSQLQAIHTKLDSDVKQARTNCRQMTDWLKTFTPDGDSMVEETPRTLFKSLKRGLV